MISSLGFGLNDAMDGLRLTEDLWLTDDLRELAGYVGGIGLDADDATTAFMCGGMMWIRWRLYGLVSFYPELYAGFCVKSQTHTGRED